MAMLAEPRRKQRIGPNPRGKFFTEDDDNRGRQMLMKMGWKTGDGLGATSQGMNEPIKPKINTDSRGLGFDRKKDPWVAHNEEFEQLLNNLNNSAETDDSISKIKSRMDDESSNSANEGLEKKSKGSRSRIHYHKFVKNKDLSRASTKDISCIFGKSLDETSAVFSVLNAESLVEPEPMKTAATITCGLKGFVKSEDGAADLWEKPLKKKKKKSSKEVDSEEVTPTQNTKDSSSEEPAETVEKSEKSKKKRKRKGQDLTEDVLCENLENTTCNDAEQLNNIPEVFHILEEPEMNETPKKKKKKSKKHKNGDAEPEGADTATTVPTLSTNECESHETLEHNDCETEDSSIKKKKRKKKHNTETPEEGVEESVKLTEITDEPVIKKNKKKNKPMDEESKDVVGTDAIENNVQENICISETEVSAKKKKKSKKRKHICSEEESSETTQLSGVPIEESINDNQCETDVTSAKKKKKRKKNHAENGDEMEESGSSPQTEDLPNPNKTGESDTAEKFINRGSIVDYFKSKMLSKGLSLPSSINM